MIPDWRQAIADYIREQARPVDKYSHQPRLYALACRLGTGVNYDDEVLYAACWLHDLGVFIGHRPEDPAQLARWDNLAYALDKVPGLLAGWGFPATKIPAVLEAIAQHMPASRPVAPAAVLLQRICWSSWGPWACCAPSPRWAGTPATPPLPICCRC